MAKTKDKILQKVDPAEALRLGSDVAQFKRRTDAKRWKQIVDDAHKRGFTVRSAITEAGQPDALRERTQASLKTEAEKNIADAYTPAAAAIDSQEGRAKALSAKRASDGIAFRTWQEQQQTKIVAASADAQKRYETYLAGQQAQAAGRDLTGQAQAAAQAAPGTVSDMSQSKAIQGLSADQQRSEAAVADARAHTAALIPSVQAQQQNVALSTRGTYAAGEAQRIGDQNKDLTDVFTAREKLTTSRAADAIKEFTRLKDNEYTKATGNRDYNAAAEKLGIQSWKDQQDAKTAAAVASNTADAAATTATNNAGAEGRKYGYSPKEWLALAAPQRAGIVERSSAGKKTGPDLGKVNDYGYPDGEWRKLTTAQRQAVIAASKKTAAADKGPTPAQTKTSQTVDSTVDQVRNLLVGYHQRFPAGKSAQGKSFRDLLIGKGYSSMQIDVAEDLRKNNGKLSARGRLKARRIGILNPEQLYGSA